MRTRIIDPFLSTPAFTIADALIDGLFSRSAPRCVNRIPHPPPPSISMSEDCDGYHLEADLPGLAAEDVELTVSEYGVTLSASRDIENESGEYASLFRERRPFQFVDRWVFQKAVAVDAAEAEMSDGRLRVHLPLRPETRPQTIAIHSATRSTAEENQQ